MYSTDKYKGEIQTNTKEKYKQSGGEIETMTRMKRKEEKKSHNYREISRWIEAEIEINTSEKFFAKKQM